MISVGEKAPEFELNDHFGRKVGSKTTAGNSHLMLLFYPLDFTPTWSKEVPALEALQKRFTAANTMVVGISVDSVHCHANWARSLGGISFPLLADFHPKGAVAAGYGAYLEGGGITDRATVIIDAGGVVRYSESVTPAGIRDMAALAAEAEKIDGAFGGDLAGPAKPQGVPADAVLYVKNNCGFSKSVLMAVANLGLADTLTVRNTSEDAAALTELKRVTGGEQAPALVRGDNSMLESKTMIRHLATLATGL